MEKLSSYEYQQIDFSDSASLLAYAKKLEGHTFREVLELGIVPAETGSTNSYNAASFKGGMGTLLEERYFGYKANDNPAPDFEEAGIELKTTCFDLRKDGTKRAGERLVLGMIAYDETIELPLEESHMWAKGSNILLIYYHREPGVDRYDQRIEYVALFTPPAAEEGDGTLMSDGHRAFCMGNALVVGIPYKIGCSITDMVKGRN